MRNTMSSRVEFSSRIMDMPATAEIDRLKSQKSYSKQRNNVTLVLTWRDVSQAPTFSYALIVLNLTTLSGR